MKTANIMNATNSNVTNKIQDFGQKIGGARKDYARAAADFAASLVGTTPERLKALALSKVVSSAQLQKVCAGLPAPAACAAVALFRSIGTKPATPYRLSRWVENTAAKLDKIAAIVAGGAVAEEIQQMPEYRVLMAANYPAEPFTFGRYTVDSVPRWVVFDYDGVAADTDKNAVSVCAGGFYRLKNTTPAAAAEYIRAAVAQDAAKRKEGATFVLRRSGSTYYAAPKGREAVRVMEWHDRAAADAGMKDLATLRAAWERIRTTPALRRTANRPRVGVDYRHGLSITPEAFADAFHFRGVEFGNWLTQGDRETRLNETFDALHDLCKLIGITPEMATLKGWLAMAFGSRGIPGAAAHFEHDHRVINLTKENGAGSLAHEWFHALDAFTAARFDMASGKMSIEDWPSLPDGELQEAARALYSGLAKSPVLRRAEALDEIRGKKYYAKIREMAARCFETYVIELAKAQGWTLDFLANVVEAWSNEKSSLYPYPTADEIGELAPLYARYLKAAAAAEELNQDAAALFAQGAARVAVQREQIKQKQEAAAAEYRQQREQEVATAVAELDKKVAALCAECGATWHFTGSDGRKPFAVGGGSGFFFQMWPGGQTAFRVLQMNNRIKKDFRCFCRVYLQIRKGVNVEKTVTAAARAGWTYANIEFVNLFKYADVMTWAEFSAKYAQEIADAARAFSPAALTAEEKAAETPATASDKAMRTTAKSTTQKPATAEENGQNDDATPADGLALVEIAGGVAVVGDSRTTYKNRKAIKSHGARWNKAAARWEATTPEAVASVRAWFGLTEATTTAEDAPTTATATDAPATAQESTTTAEDTPTTATATDDTATAQEATTGTPDSPTATTPAHAPTTGADAPQAEESPIIEPAKNHRFSVGDFVEVLAVDGSRCGCVAQVCHEPFGSGRTMIKFFGNTAERAVVPGERLRPTGETTTALPDWLQCGVELETLTTTGARQDGPQRLEVESIDLPFVVFRNGQESDISAVLTYYAPVGWLARSGDA